MGIGKTLSDILNEKRSNPNDLAERIGVSPSTIYSIIKRDNMKVDISVLAKICSELNVSMERFYKEYIDSKDNKSSNDIYIEMRHQLLNNFDFLDPIGKEKLVTYSNDLVQSGNYIENEQKEKRAPSAS